MMYNEDWIQEAVDVAPDTVTHIDVKDPFDPYMSYQEDKWFMVSRDGVVDNVPYPPSSGEVNNFVHIEYFKGGLKDDQ